jgi:hypothetical protein
MRSNWCGALCIVHRCDVQTGMVLCILYIGVMYKLVWCSVYFTLVSCINWCGARYSKWSLPLRGLRVYLLTQLYHSALIIKILSLHFN